MSAVTAFVSALQKFVFVRARRLRFSNSNASVTSNVKEKFQSLQPVPLGGERFVASSLERARFWGLAQNFLYTPSLALERVMTLKCSDQRSAHVQQGKLTQASPISA